MVPYTTFDNNPQLRARNENLATDVLTLRSENSSLGDEVWKLETELQLTKDQLQQAKSTPSSVQAEIDVGSSGTVHWRAQIDGDITVAIWGDQANIGRVIAGKLPITVPVKFKTVNRVGKVQIKMIEPPSPGNPNAKFTLSGEGQVGLVIIWERL